jgi:hypothetical protein
MELNTKSVLIHHHLGLGDHIVCNAIVRKLHKKYKKIKLAVLHHNLSSVKQLYRDIDVELCPVNSDSDCEKMYKNNKFIRIGFENCKLPNWEESFYEQMNIDYSYRFSHFFIERDYERENLLEQKLELTGKFSFHNNSYSGGKIEINSISFLHKIFLSPITDSIFDWIGVLEKAEEIHTIDSAIFQLIKQLNLNSKKYFYDIQSIVQSRTKKLPTNWFIINI